MVLLFDFCNQIISIVYRADEIARTVYVGNVNNSLTDEHLKEFFGSCGEVLFTKLAGEADGSRPTRFAFVEFRTMDMAAKVVHSLSFFTCRLRSRHNHLLTLNCKYFEILIM